MSRYDTNDDTPPAYSSYYEIQPNTPENVDSNRVLFSCDNNSRIIHNIIVMDEEVEPLILNIYNNSNNIAEEPNPSIHKTYNAIIKESREFAICVLVLITIFLVGFSIVHLPGALRDKDPDDVTKVPRTFQLRWRSIFGDDYAMVIESYDTDYKGLSGFSEYDYTNVEPSINVTDNEIKYPIRALILDRNYNKGEYSVEEYFYKPNREDYYKRIITADAEFKGNWPAEFLITFTSKGSDRDPASVEVCDYKLSYSKDLTGHVLRKCTKAFETRFSVQAYVHGSVNDGLYFTESEEGDTWYAFTAKPSWIINYSRRDVFVHEYAPFPPLIPALYSVYYDFLSRKF